MIVVYTDIGGIERLKKGETVQGWINRLDEDDISIEVDRERLKMSDYPYLFIKPQENMTDF